MRRSEKTPTIQDVARHADVSAATVSRALNAPERVSEATRARIAEAVRATGYTVNQAARTLRQRASRTLLIALPNIGNPFYSTILDAVIHEAATRGYGALVANRLGHDPTQWLKDYFVSNRADGLLLFDSSLDLMALREWSLNGAALPLVMCCDEIPPPEMNLVMTDNFEAARRAVAHLVGLGHRRIGHLATRTYAGLRNERLAGFFAAMRDAGLEVRPDWVLPGDFSLASGEAAGAAFLALEDRPTALFCANDESLIGFLAAVRPHGLDCPRDVSLIGFDDIAVARDFHPPLTTMAQPRAAMGQRATQALLDILEGIGPPQPLRIVLPSDLTVRASTAPYCQTAR